MAEWPKRIQDLFITKITSKSGAYSVKICDMGIWKEIVVSDMIPCSASGGGGGGSPYGSPYGGYGGGGNYGANYEPVGCTSN
jgi:hypothetical protein